MIVQGSTTHQNIRQQIIALQQKPQQITDCLDQLGFTQNSSFERDPIDQLFVDYYQDDSEYKFLSSRQAMIQPSQVQDITSNSTLVDEKNQNQNQHQLGFSTKGKKIKKVNTCQHVEKPHYAKDMCRSCYSKYGRVKKPWMCSHEKLYAQGLCQGCYTNTYNHMRRMQRDSNNQEGGGGQ